MFQESMSVWTIMVTALRYVLIPMMDTVVCASLDIDLSLSICKMLTVMVILHSNAKDQICG